MAMTDFFLPSSDPAQQLHYQVWEPADAAPVAVLQIIHGMEEYVARYDTLARELVARGWAVIGHDHLGHGQSGTWERGFFTDRPDHADIVINDIHRIHLEAHRRWPGRKVFVMGHSMGSFFLRRYLEVYGSGSAVAPITVETAPTTAETAPTTGIATQATVDTAPAGAIVCGTGWYPPFIAGSALCAARIFKALCGAHCRSKLLTTIVSPHALAFRSEGESAWLSRDPENVRRFLTDPLCHFGFTTGAYCTMHTVLYRVSRIAGYGPTRFPILVVSGAEDSVGGAKAVRKVAAHYRSHGFTDVTEMSVPNDRHEVIMEPDGPQVRAAIADWLTDRL